MSETSENAWLEDASKQVEENHTDAPASLDKARDKKKKKKEDSVELWYRRHLVNDRSLSVYVDASGVPEIYRWAGNPASPARGSHWERMSDDDHEAYVEAYVSSNHNAGYGRTKVASCGWLTEKILKNLGRTLPDPDPEECFVSTESHLLHLDVVTGTIRALDHDPKIFARTHVPIHLDPKQLNDDGTYTPIPHDLIEEDPGLFGTLIRGTFPDVEVRDAWRESFGDTLSPILTQRIPWLLGPGGNGKSQWLGLGCALNSNSAAFNLETGSSFDLEDVLGKSFLAIDEVDKGAQCEKTLKQLWGAEKLKVSRKFRRSVSIRPAFKGMAASNFLPPFAEHSEAIKRRIDPFWLQSAFHDTEYQVYDMAQKIIRGGRLKLKDGSVKRVESEMGLVLDWALSGLLIVLQRGRLRLRSEMPAACQKLFSEFEREMDPVLRFAEELEMEPGNDLYDTQSLFENYRQWCVNVGKKPCGDVVFWKDVRRFFDVKHGVGSLGEKERPRILEGGVRTRVNAYRMKLGNPGAFLKPLKAELTTDEDAAGNPMESGNFVRGGA